MNLLNVVKEIGSNKYNSLSSPDTFIFPIKYVESHDKLYDINEIQAEHESGLSPVDEVPYYIKQNEGTDISSLRTDTAFDELIDVYDICGNYQILYEKNGKGVKITGIQKWQEEASPDWAGPITPEDPYIYLVVSTSSNNPK